MAYPAPYAALVEALGPPTPVGPASAAAAPRRAALGAPWPLFLTILALLLAEWASRRARGSR
ncbi:MAG: hypothetical protein AVDCRST_MAG40-2359 [uncultured Gemmatimonadaceae bacterium]|uniref:Uncharacterized protein n=1 Tax=uncultured Gemmatimonadaceae bacterium TaxID=246130 RepID=A0A6J4LS40_9BACT|nr:MAG: hypothetical protein AVDCRST_MAG40-2359 [uncultured Gemmatimonadaceae bacterium]